MNMDALPVKELCELGSATIYEASGLPCALPPDFRPAWPGARCAGPALTVTAAPGDNLPLHWAVASASPGDILVVDAGGSKYGYWGEVLAVAAQARGIAGLIIDGGVRDTDRLAELRFPVFSTAVTILGTGKSWPGVIGGPIHLRGHDVASGDLVVADADGIAIVPSSQVDAAVQASRARAAKEADFMERLREGALTLDLYGFRGLADPEVFR